MANQSNFGYDNTPEGMQPAPPGTGGGVPVPGQYKFSPEEMRVLQECNQESFYQRSLPIGTVLGFGTFAAIQQGYLKTNARFGVFPKITLAVIVGYFVGKVSYQNQCAEKLMALPGSYIGQLLRDKKEGRMKMKPDPPTMFGANQTDIYSDAGPGSSLNLDTDRPLFNDDSYHPRADTGVIPNPDDATVRPAMTYDELRRKNRGEHAEAKKDPYNTDYGDIPVVTRRLSPPPTAPPSSSQHKNKYGDVVD